MLHMHAQSQIQGVKHKGLTLEVLLGLHLDGEAEISQFDVHVVIQENIFWLQVSVNYVLGVKKADHF